MNLSYAQLKDLAQQAGFTGDAIDIAAAIALAESGGNPAAHAFVTIPKPGFKPEDSRGLWQINVLAHPQYMATNLYDPATNARAAFAVSMNGKMFSPWTSYGSGAYKKYLQITPPPVPGVGPTTPPQTVPYTNNIVAFLSDQKNQMYILVAITVLLVIIAMYQSSKKQREAVTA